MIYTNIRERTSEIYIDNRDNKDLNGYHLKTNYNELLIVNDTLFIFNTAFKNNFVVHKVDIKGKELKLSFYGSHIHESIEKAEADFKKFTLYVAVPTFLVFLPLIFYMMYKITGN